MKGIELEFKQQQKDREKEREKRKEVVLNRKRQTSKHLYTLYTSS